MTASPNLLSLGAAADRPLWVDDGRMRRYILTASRIQQSTARAPSEATHPLTRMAAAMQDTDNLRSAPSSSDRPASCLEWLAEVSNPGLPRGETLSSGSLMGSQPHKRREIPFVVNLAREAGRVIVVRPVNPFGVETRDGRAA